MCEIVAGQPDGVSFSLGEKDTRAKREPDRAKPQENGRMRGNMRQNPHPAFYLKTSFNRRPGDTPPNLDGPSLPMRIYG